MNTPNEFAQIMHCKKCTLATSKKLLRDQLENIPQPGFIGQNYNRKRIVLAGQNPGVCPPAYAKIDSKYTSALRAVRDTPNQETMGSLYRVLLHTVPGWKVGDYFPLNECRLSLEEIAYFNIVRCRTMKNSIPGQFVVRNCLTHFENWLLMLRPSVVIFIGKWAFDKAGHIPKQHNIPCDFMNRERSLSTAARKENRHRVETLVRSIIG